MNKFPIVFFVAYAVFLLLYVIASIVFFSDRSTASLVPYLASCSVWAYLFAKKYARPMTSSENVKFSFLAVLISLVVSALFVGGFLIVAQGHEDVAAIIDLVKATPVVYFGIGLVVVLIVYFIVAYFTFWLMGKIFSKAIEANHERLVG